MGPTELMTTNTNNHYHTELKIAAVKAYLRGKGSLKDICKKFKIRNKRQLRSWIALYNKGHIDPRAGAGHGIYGYRRLADELNARYGTGYNYKRIYRMTRLVGAQSSDPQETVPITNAPHRRWRRRTS